MVETGEIGGCPELEKFDRHVVAICNSPKYFLMIFVFKNDSLVSERDLAMASLPHSGFCKHE